MTGSKRPDTFFADLARMAGERMSAAEIADALKTTKNAIIGAAHRKGITILTRSADKRLGGRPRTIHAPRVHKPIKLPSVVPHVIVTKATVKPAEIGNCVWHGCTRSAFARGKPYCTEHHIKGRGLF